MRTIVTSVVLVATAAAALWLLNDAMTFALYAPSAERAVGCYTTIEDWVGVKRPGRIRTAEASSGLGLLVTVVTLPLWQIFRRESGRASPS
jgi:hypothetical protein